MKRWLVCAAVMLVAATGYCQDVVTFALPGTLGTNVGAGSDGVLIGTLTATDPGAVLLKGCAQADPVAAQADASSYTTYTTEIQEATADDVVPLPATPAVDDAFYVGHASKTFAQVDLVCSTQGAGTWTVTWEYWDGDSYEALADVTDGTTGFTAATGTQTLTFTKPSDWAANTVNSVLAYWIRGRVSAYTSVTTQPLYTRGYVVAASADATWADDTTDFTDAGAGDVALLPTYPVVGDAIYIGGSTEKFCKAKVTTSQARTGTATITPQYWDGDSWESITTVDDDSVGWSATAGTLLINFVPPSDWVANTAANGPNGEAGYFIAMALTAKTSVTQQPLATQGWILPYKTGATGARLTSGRDRTLQRVTGNALTKSGATGDSVFLVVNTTTGQAVSFTWTKANALVSALAALTISANDQVAIVQVAEDGTTELANGNLFLQMAP